MNEDRLPWFPCEPGPLLGALAGMPAPKQLVYVIVLLRIYENGGACPDTLAAIALRTRLNKRVVSDALDELFREGRLIQGAGGIHNPKADAIVADSKALLEKRKVAGAKGGLSKAQKDKQNQENMPSKASDLLQHSHRQEHLQEQDSLFSNENRVPAPKANPAEALEPNEPDPDPAPVKMGIKTDWPKDYQTQFWDAYPRHTEKKAAMTKLDGGRKSGIAWAPFIAAVYRYRHHVRQTRTEERFIKHPATWLNRGCWDDELSNGGNGEANRNNAPGGGKSGYANIAAGIVRRQVSDSELFDQQFAAGDQPINRH